MFCFCHKNQKSLITRKSFSIKMITPCATSAVVSDLDREAKPCGGSYLESITLCSVSESPAITYFVSQEFREASIKISGENHIALLDFPLKEGGYGQYMIQTGELKAGINNCCLLLDGRELDCKKLIVMK